MAHYSSSGLSFDPSPAAAASASTSNLTPKIWDKILHEQVQNKSFWKNMIGKDKGGEGSLDKSISNYPIVQKTDLKKSSGDKVVLGLVKAVNLADETTVTYLNYGKVTGQELIDAESGLTFYYADVPVTLYRDGVLIENEMSVQRSPFDLYKIATDGLANKMAHYRDSGFFFAFYAKYDPALVRSGYTSVAHPNLLYGKNKTALTEVDSNDPLDTDLLERIAVYGKVNNINPVTGLNGLGYGLIVHPFGVKTLRADSIWKDAQQGAAARGSSNDIFTGNVGTYAGITVLEDNRISTAKTYASISISTYEMSSISAATMGNIAATDARMNILIGANAMAEAFAKETFVRRRKEDDYGEKAGFGSGFIRGAMRADFLPDMASSTTAVNQSSAICYTYSPSPIGNFSSIW